MSERNPQTEAELVAFVRSIDVAAPASLHTGVQALVADQQTRHTPRGARRSRLAVPVLAGALAAVAAIVIALVAFAGGGGSGMPDELHAASQLTLGGAMLGAPAESPRNRSELTAQVDGVSFPYWEESFGWRASGARVDRVGGRLVRTVFYTNARGQRIGYAIVGGTPPPRVSGGTELWVQGKPFRLLQIGDAKAIAWLRSGRLCVVSGRGVDGATLLRLASWHARGAVTA